MGSFKKLWAANQERITERGKSAYKSLRDAGIKMSRREADVYARLDAMVELLDAHLEEQQTKTFLDMYAGIWAQGTPTPKGQLVTHAGSLWCALEKTTDRPGTSDHFKLVCKKGRDAR